MTDPSQLRQALEKAMIEAGVTEVATPNVDAIMEIIAPVLEQWEQERQELIDHENATHRELGAILGTDSSLADKARQLKTRAEYAERQVQAVTAECDRWRQALERLMIRLRSMADDYERARLRLRDNRSNRSTIADYEARCEVMRACANNLSALLAGERRAQEEPPLAKHGWQICPRCGKDQGARVGDTFGFKVCDPLCGQPASPPAHPVAQEPTALHGELRALLDTAWRRGGPDLYAHVLRIGLREMRKTIEAGTSDRQLQQDFVVPAPPVAGVQEPTISLGRVKDLLETLEANCGCGDDAGPCANCERIIEFMEDMVHPAASSPAAPAPSEPCEHSMRWDARGGAGECMKCHQRLVCRNAKRTSSGRLDCGLHNLQCGYPSCMIPFEQAPSEQE